MYAEDSFFTLTVPGQFGPAFLSATLGLIAIGVTWRLCRGRKLILRLIVALLVFTAFIWLAPQIYYTYYIFLLDGLRWQIVIPWPPSPLDLLNLLLFRETHNLSFHAQGFLGWVLLAVAMYRR